MRQHSVMPTVVALLWAQRERVVQRLPRSIEPPLLALKASKDLPLPPFLNPLNP